MLLIMLTDTVAAKSQIFVNSGLLGWLRMLLIMFHFYSNPGIPSFPSARFALLVWLILMWWENLC
jgi:hypothetical protein